MNITEHIEKNGISREEVCKRAGISRAYLSLLEKNKRSVGPKIVSKLASALGVQSKELRPDWADALADDEEATR